MFKQIELPYGFDALEPSIDTKTMEIHYGKHHAAYTNNLNSTLKDNAPQFLEKSIEEILTNLKKNFQKRLQLDLVQDGLGLL